MGANQVDLAYAFGLPPERAIRYFETLGYTVPTDWPQRMQQAAAKAQTIAGIYRQDVVADIHRALGESAAKGTPFAKFRDAVERQLRQAIWWMPPPASCWAKASRRSAWR